MFVSGQHEPLLPFPRLPETVKARHSISDLALRPFGLYESDLSVDFNHTPRPLLVTQILECCTRDGQREEVDESFFWSLTVGKRIECLLTLVSTPEQPKISVAFLCPNGECGRELEIELAVEEISELQAQAYLAERLSVQVGNEQLTLRRPTGNDQLAWLKGSFTEEDAALRQMLRTLLQEEAEITLMEDRMPGDLVHIVGRVMEEYDPLVNFSLGVHCPDCKQVSQYEIDLEALSLRRLQRAQLRLLTTVHRLAKHYHWSEGEIFDVPYWRRAHYLSFIEKERNR